MWDVRLAKMENASFSVPLKSWIRTPLKILLLFLQGLGYDWGVETVVTVETVGSEGFEREVGKNGKDDAVAGEGMEVVGVGMEVAGEGMEVVGVGMEVVGVGMEVVGEGMEVVGEGVVVKTLRIWISGRLSRFSLVKVLTNSFLTFSISTPSFNTVT